MSLGLELVREHESHAGGAVTVVPVVVEDLDAAIPVLSAVCSLLNGRLLDTRSHEFQSQIPATEDPARMQIVVGGVDTEQLVGRSLKAAVDGNQGEVWFDPPAAAPTPAEGVLLAMGAALLHRSLDEHELVVIAYSESTIDVPIREALWSWVVDQWRGRPHAKLITLVLAVEGAVNASRHCQTGRGMRFGVKDGRLLTRNIESDLGVEARSLAGGDGPLVLFLGAGFSFSSNMPMGNELRDQAILALLPELKDRELSSSELAGAFYDFASKKWLEEAELREPRERFVAELTLEQVIRVERNVHDRTPTLEAFRERHDKWVEAPGSAVTCLGALLSMSEHKIVVVEVNFDLLVERHAKADLRVFATAEEFKDAADYVSRYLAGEEKAVPVLKLHGTISDPESCIVRSDQTENGLGPDKLAALKALIGPKEAPTRVVYVGMSMRDHDLNPTLGSEEFAAGFDERWVAPYLESSVEEFARDRPAWWRAHGRQRDVLQKRVITEAADAFFDVLLREWQPHPRTANK